MTVGMAVRVLALSLAPLVLIPSTVGCGGKCGPRKAVVSEIIDGDTLRLESGEKIRLFLVNTPETTGGKNECFGQEAKQFVIDMVEGKEVRLDYGKECVTTFDRVLAYVTVDGRELNTLLVERGYGCAFFVPPSGEERYDEFEALELDARAANRGLWGSCQVITCQD